MSGESIFALKEAPALLTTVFSDVRGGTGTGAEMGVVR